MSPSLIPFLLNALLLLADVLALPTVKNPPKDDASYWLKLGINEVRQSLVEKIEYKNEAKNVILFLGDGMGVSTVTAARIYKAQRKKKRVAWGEETYLTFERFHHLGLVKTYNTDRSTPDSAATSTAYLTGVKGNMGTIGVDNHVLFGDCSSYKPEYDVTSVWRDALKAGKSVGLVTTTRVTHASPAGTYASIAHRDWESDTRRNKDVKDPMLQKRCPDIAQQLIERASDFNVVFGGGRLMFAPNTWSDPSNHSIKGDRSDGRNLLDEWVAIHKKKKHRASRIYTRKELLNLDYNKVDYVLGLFNPSDLDYDEDNQLKNEAHRHPSLTEMTEAAIKILQKNPKGFILFVEGGRIDHGHHVNEARHALGETVAFESAIHKATVMTKARETLTMVTADHSHMFTYGGYSARGKDVLIGSGPNDKPYGDLGDDKLPFLSIIYGNGPGAANNKPRANLEGVDTTGLLFKFPALAPLKYSTHGGEDVPIYSQGPFAHLFYRVHEQTHVAMVARFAACLPPFKCEKHCK